MASRSGRAPAVTAQSSKDDGPAARLKLWMSRILIASVAVSLVMAVFRPVPGGRHYEYALILSVSLTLIWLLYTARPQKFFGRGAAAFVLAAGLILGTVNLLVIKTDSEIVRTYRTVFDALEAGKNPYTAGTIYHEIEGLGPVYGNFNYPPPEILPYYLAYRLAGTWNITVLAAAMIVIQAFAVAILFLTLPRLRPARLWPFVPMILLGEVKTTVAMTLLVTAAALWTIKKDETTPRPVYRYATAVLFGLGSMTKFLIVPLALACFWHKFDRKNLRSLGTIAVDLGIAAATVLLVMAPFGIVDVFKNTALFNIVLEDRAALTTFYPNVLSGPLAWIGWGSLFPFAAFALLILAVLAAPKLDRLTAMMVAAIVFNIVATTPEAQFLPVLVLIAVVAQGTAVEAAGREGPDKALAGILRPAKENEA
jgi:hypothetical protein